MGLKEGWIKQEEQIVNNSWGSVMIAVRCILLFSLFECIFGNSDNKSTKYKEKYILIKLKWLKHFKVCFTLENLPM